MSEPKISVIIPVRNGADKIERCLEAVFSQSLRPHETIVVDGHSDDDTVNRAGRFPTKILYEDYRTRGGACQIGVENAEGEYTAFTDADCVPDKDWLSNLFRGFGDEIVGVGGAIKNIGEELWVRSVNLAYGTFLGSGSSVQGRVFKDSRYVKSISGCNSMYRKETVLEVGGFKVNLPGAEDTELNGRLLARGKLLYVPDAIVFHHHGRGLKEFAIQMLRYGRDRAVAQRWDLQVIPPLMIPFILLSLLFTLWVFLGLLGLYLVILAAMGLRFAIGERDVRFLVSVPIVYAVQHSLYALGLWRGLILRR